MEMEPPKLSPREHSPTTPQSLSTTNQAQVYSDLLHQTSITY